MCCWCGCAGISWGVAGSCALCVGRVGEEGAALKWVSITPWEAVGCGRQGKLKVLLLLSQALLLLCCAGACGVCACMASGCVLACAGMEGVGVLVGVRESGEVGGYKGIGGWCVTEGGHVPGPKVVVVWGAAAWWGCVGVEW